jgi:hypothetical protein
MAAQPISTLDEPSSKKAPMPSDEAKPSNFDNPSPEILTVKDGFPEKLPSPNKVNWENDNDPQNPMNWSSSVKWQNLGVISAMAFIT